MTYTSYLNTQLSTLYGGGEGIRTPDPRVANAVLCQLSYAPDKKFEFRNSNFEIQMFAVNIRPAG